MIANLDFILIKKQTKTSLKYVWEFHRLWFCRKFSNGSPGTISAQDQLVRILLKGGAIVVQDPFQLDFCVTSAYNTQAWKNHCKYISRLMSIGFGNTSGKGNLEDFFEMIPQIVRKQINYQNRLKGPENVSWRAEQQNKKQEPFKAKNNIF